MPAEIHGGDKDTGAIIALDGRLSSPPPEQKRLPPLVEGTLTPGAAKFGKLIDMINLQLVWSGDKRIRDVCLATALGFEHPKRIRCWIALCKADLRTQGDLVTDPNEPTAYLLNEHQALLAIMQAKTVNGHGFASGIGRDGL